MLCSIHVGALGWTRRPDLERDKPELGQVWQAPAKDGQAGRIKAFGPGRRPNILHKAEDEMVVPSYSGW